MKQDKKLFQKIKEKVCEQHSQWINPQGEIESFCCETYKEEAQYMTSGPVHMGKCLKCSDIDKILSEQKT
jgi:hypothetical protein